MRKRAKFTVILECEQCGEKGAAEFSYEFSVKSQLESPKSKIFVDCGFRYGSLAGGKWCIHCDSCHEDSERLIALHEEEKAQFAKGKSLTELIHRNN